MTAKASRPFQHKMSNFGKANTNTFIEGIAYLLCTHPVSVGNDN